MVENAKIKVQSAKLRNPDLVGMGVLIVASFSISRILYLLDVYYTRWEVGCQVNSWPQRNNHELARIDTKWPRRTPRRRNPKYETRSFDLSQDRNRKQYQSPKFQMSKTKRNRGLRRFSLIIKQEFTRIGTKRNETQIRQISWRRRHKEDQTQINAD